MSAGDAGGQQLTDSVAVVAAASTRPVATKSPTRTAPLDIAATIRSADAVTEADRASAAMPDAKAAADEVPQKSA